MHSRLRLSPFERRKRRDRRSAQRGQRLCEPGAKREGPMARRAELHCRALQGNRPKRVCFYARFSRLDVLRAVASLLAAQVASRTRNLSPMMCATLGNQGCDFWWGGDSDLGLPGHQQYQRCLSQWPQAGRAGHA
ncbi:hypothetical protein VFPFJ_11112 [Purpureocillium lilacinum]|uniref:Uncharacterized protein n=1 Tax=Purpureocillium lilacinum TaxID=33203 RepID=A0A179FR05_PURLI|nr:hypothetical protein VFPFJ_11112 [Purpureocillium lilacinum]OAQ67523.1 hypothetical protein VFPFJ_11112 [Purpureocillium lilacinum]